MNYFQVIWHEQVPLVIAFPLFQILFFPAGYIFILGMIQDEIFHLQLFCQFTGILYRRMMLLIRFEDIRLSIQTKSLMQNPNCFALVEPMSKKVAR